MLHRNPTNILSCLLAVSLFCVAGCGANATTETAPANAEHDHDGHGHDDHGHDHDFDNLGEAVAEIDELATEIATAFTSGKPGMAHDALHHIAEVLEATETVVSKSSLGEDAKSGALKAVEDLFDSFTALDETMHGEIGKDFDEVKSTIESAVATLKTAAKE